MDLYEAIADPTRRAMLEQLADGPVAATALAARFPVSQPAVAKHLRVLREAGLVEPLRVPEDARIRLYRLRPDRLEEAQAWLQRIWQRRLNSYAEYVEERA